MDTIEAVRRSVVSVTIDQTIRDAAVLMEKAGVGAVVVLEGTVPVGIVTDRDLVGRALARDVPSRARVDSVMSSPVVTIDAAADLHEAYAIFGGHGIRRLAVVRDGVAVGVLAIDDLLIDLANDLANLARPITGEAIFGERDARVPATR